MKFNSEYELVNQFIVNEKRKSNCLIITELETNFGRPDIVIIYFNENVLSKRREINSNYRYKRSISYILSYLFNKGWVSLERITNYFSFSEKEMEQIINELNNAGVIEIRGNLVKSKPIKDILAINRIRVIEAKLNNWKYVIEQAIRHQWFTKESSILLPDKSTYVLQQTKIRCEEMGIGLYLIEDLKNKEIIKPPAKGIINTPLLWELNEKLLSGGL